MSEHEQYWNLCTAYALGTISDRDIEILQSHLNTCKRCRERIEEAEEMIAFEIPLGAPEFQFLPVNTTLNNAINEAHGRALQRARSDPEFTNPEVKVPAREARSWRWISDDLKRWALPAIAVGVALMGTVTVQRIWRGGKHGNEFSRSAVELPTEVSRGDGQGKGEARDLHQGVDELRRDRERLRSELERDEHSLHQMEQELQKRDMESAELRNQLRTSSEAVEHLQAQLGQEQASRADLGQKLAESEKLLHEVQGRLETTLSERANYMATADSLERRLGDVSRELKEKTNSLEQQEELLSHDRDIRDIVGARDLYVAEVNDVGRDAKTQEPFGRVFFTKGKSLIFYAYDLERQSNLKKSGTFQAWGRRGRDFNQALPLGIMYLDSSAKRRWVLRFDDPTTLAKIDAVFVTVEPAGGSERPTGKPLLFAYLRIEPNHP